MRRFSWYSRKHTMRKMWLFCRENGQLLFLTFLVCVGALIGALCYKNISFDSGFVFTKLPFDTDIRHDIGGACLAVMSTALYGWFFLVALFLLGLTAYGCPLMILVPLLFGFFTGVSECYVYMCSGMWVMMKSVLIPSVAVGIAVISATGQAMGLSCSFSRQLLPSHAHCGGLWQSFKMYLLRFGICFLIVLFGAIVAVLLRWI